MAADLIDLDSVAAHFDANFQERGEVGASVSIWQGDTELISLNAGFADRKQTRPWNAETIAPLWSITKGFAAASVLVALEEANLELNDPVSKVWPALKGITFGQVLSHQAGLAAIDDPPPLTDYDAVIAALEAQAENPNWEPGTLHGYHPRTHGYLTDEIVRRLTGATSLGAFWRERIAEPLDLDLWIGLPEREDERVAEMIPANLKAGTLLSEFYQAFQQPDSFVRRAFGSPKGLASSTDLNQPENRRLRIPSFTGIGSARSVAKLYGHLASDGFFSPQIRHWAEQTLTSGHDRTLLQETAFSAGFMKTRHLLPSERSFGQPGAGGSHAFAVPEFGLGFGYVMNQMELSVLPTEKALGFLGAFPE